MQRTVFDVVQQAPSPECLFHTGNAKDAERHGSNWESVFEMF